MKAVVYFYRLAAFCAVGFLLTGCGALKAADVQPEVVLAEDSSVVVAFDFSDSGQVADFKSLVKSFPDDGLFDEFVAEFDVEADSEWSYDKAFKPVLDKDWKVVMGVALPEGLTSFDDIDSLLPSDFAFYVAGKFEKADEVELLLEHFLGKQMGEALVRSEDGDYTYWVNSADDFYLSRYGDLFFITNSEENRTAAIARIDAREGFVVGGNLSDEKIVKENKLGYVFVKSEGLFDLFGAFYEEMGMGMISQYLNMMGDVYLSVVADKSGLSLNSLAEVDEENELMVAYKDYELSLLDMIPGGDVIYYMEDPDFLNVFESMMFSVSSAAAQAGANYSDPDNLDVFDSPSVDVDYYKVALDELSSLSGVSVAEIETLFASPFAFSISDVGALYPTASFYLKLEDDVALASAKSLAIGLDAFANDVIAQFDVLMAQLGVGAGVLKKDVDLVAGNGLHKLSVDFSIFPAEILTQLEMIVGDVSGFKVELYYGILNDEVMVFALYPDLPEVYGKSVFSENELYFAGVDKLDGVFGNKLSFFNPAPVMSLYERYLGIEAIAASDSDKEIFARVKSYVNNMKYGIGSSVLEGGLLKSTAYLKIGEK